MSGDDSLIGTPLGEIFGGESWDQQGSHSHGRVVMIVLAVVIIVIIIAVFIGVIIYLTGRDSDDDDETFNNSGVASAHAASKVSPHRMKRLAPLPLDKFDANPNEQIEEMPDTYNMGDHIPYDNFEYNEDLSKYKDEYYHGDKQYHSCEHYDDLFDDDYDEISSYFCRNETDYLGGNNQNRMSNLLMTQ